MGVLEAAEDLGARVAEGIVKADADDGIARADGSEEGWSCRGAAAVVADLEEGGRCDAVVFEHGGFAGGFGVAFEKDTGAVEVEAEDEGVVVYGRAGIAVGELGSEDGGVEIGPGEIFASVEVADRDVLCLSLGEESAEGEGVAGVDADPELAGMEVAEDGGHAAQVVGVRVGEHEDIETAKMTGPEIGRDDLLADVPSAGDDVGAATGGTSGVHQHGLAEGADDEQGVALADVDGGDFELAGMEEW